MQSHGYIAQTLVLEILLLLKLLRYKMFVIGEKKPDLMQFERTFISGFKTVLFPSLRFAQVRTVSQQQVRMA